VVYQPLAILRPLHPVIRPFFAKDFEKAMANLVNHCQRMFGDVDPSTGRSSSR
jgi:hypothetical protein